MAQTTAAETKCDSVRRKELDRACKAKRRACESMSEKQTRKQNDKMVKASRRASAIPIERDVCSFRSKTKLGPEFVCMCCRRMLYRQTVVAYNKSNYSKANEHLLDQVFSPEFAYISPDGKQWVCNSCDRALNQGNTPLQAKANGLQLSPIPPELSGLNLLELRLISLRVPFMKMVALPSGKQWSSSKCTI